MKRIVKAIIITMAIMGTCNMIYAGDFIKMRETNDWYYIENGELIKNKWVFYDNAYYYIGNEGKMLRNTTTPDGYKVDYNGAYYNTNVAESFAYDTRIGYYKRKNVEDIKGVKNLLYITVGPSTTDAIVREWNYDDGFWIGGFIKGFAEVYVGNVKIGYVPRSEIVYDEAYNRLIGNFK